MSRSLSLVGCLTLALATTAWSPAASAQDEIVEPPQPAPRGKVRRPDRDTKKRRVKRRPKGAPAKPTAPVQDEVEEQAEAPVAEPTVEALAPDGTKNEVAVDEAPPSPATTASVSAEPEAEEEGEDARTEDFEEQEPFVTEAPRRKRRAKRRRRTRVKETVVNPNYLDEWQPGMPVPDGYAVKSGYRRGLFGAGVGIFAGTWFFSTIAAAVGEANAEDNGYAYEGGNSAETADDWVPLYIPVVGPWIAIRTLDTNAVGRHVLVMNGLLQASGVTMAIAGLMGENAELIKMEAEVETGVRVEFAPTLSGAMVKGAF
ncbi:MAG: hypothetical protein AAGA56_01365 [Myxococcota bacterium]